MMAGEADMSGARPPLKVVLIEDSPLVRQTLGDALGDPRTVTYTVCERPGVRLSP